MGPRRGRALGLRGGGDEAYPSARRWQSTSAPPAVGARDHSLRYGVIDDWIPMRKFYLLQPPLEAKHFWDVMGPMVEEAAAEVAVEAAAEAALTAGGGIPALPPRLPPNAMSQP